VRILLHICCAPCGTSAVERLLDQGHGVTLFFSNHNIDTRQEHDLRLLQVEKLADHFNTTLLVDPPDNEAWLKGVAGLENEPERGRRCAVCFRYALGRTAAKMEQDGYDGFCTTLTTSPHKVAPIIFQIGRELGGERFLPFDFKKSEGFKRSLVLSNELGLYRQSYCGCLFSRRVTN
jgi:predicted adenine nucleotide alpha hydrolase (AANH) superfamily ATPase